MDENGKLIKGKVGQDLNTDQAYKAAERCALSIAAQAKKACNNDLSKTKTKFLFNLASQEYFESIDQKSLNGTKLNGVKIKESIIKPGDVIEIGDVKFYFS